MRSREQELEGGGGLDTGESGGHTPLHVGATLSSPVITMSSREQELKGGCGLETSESGGHTPLHVGATLSSPVITMRSREQELEGGGGLETGESGGHTPLLVGATISSELRKPASTASGAWGTFWMAGEHFGPKFTQFRCIFQFVTNHALFMTNSEQKLAKIYQACFKNTPNNYFVNKHVIQNKNLRTVDTFFNVLIHALWGTFFTLSWCLGNGQALFSTLLWKNLQLDLYLQYPALKNLHTLIVILSAVILSEVYICWQ